MPEGMVLDAGGRVTALAITQVGRQYLTTSRDVLTPICAGACAPLWRQGAGLPGAIGDHQGEIITKTRPRPGVQRVSAMCSTWVQERHEQTPVSRDSWQPRREAFNDWQIQFPMLMRFNQTVDEALAEQEGDFDADSRWALT